MREEIPEKSNEPRRVRNTDGLVDDKFVRKVITRPARGVKEFMLF